MSVTTPSPPASDVDALFSALADPVRRSLVDRLTLREATLTELAEQLPISLQAVSKHLQVLESTGVITRRREGRRRPCRVVPGALDPLERWVEGYRRRTEERFSRLDALLADPASTSPAPAPLTREDRS